MVVETKDSGQRQQWATGAQRDVQEGKPQFGLIPLAELLHQQNAYGGPVVGVADFVDLTKPVEPIVGGLPEWVPTDLDDKPHPHYRPDLIPSLMLNRLAHLYGRGAEKYDDDNWKKGIPMDRVYESLLRHAIAWAAGDTEEDHLAAVIWNATTLMWTETAVKDGDLPEELATKGPLLHENERLRNRVSAFLYGAAVPDTEPDSSAGGGE